MGLALTSFHIAILFIAAAILVAAAVSDAYSYRIPNYLCGLLVALFPAFVATAPRGVEWSQNAMVFGLVALAGFAMFMGQLAGAGDVKLLSAASLWAGPHLIAVLLVVTAVAGGVLSLFMALKTHRRNAAEGGTEGGGIQIAKVPIPYGVAIASGGVVALAMLARPILLPA
ncbi:MAG: prepilin peptidase [Alphaproteobacteria bacterium]|nr:prepilin peptidase [Alphaproteobacteria bacterium]